jgi:adenine-specific DNA-methyltransferase
MPTLNWIGKEAVVNHDKEVPFRLLKKVKSASVGDNSQNLIINGDNLEALKALMPYYQGKIKCIYIDPPYNTGNEKWVYNDKVNSPKIKQWLGKVVGGESEDLCRHDKWLCMMYPRLKLLRELLREDGIIFISMDEHEFDNLIGLTKEIFMDYNYLGTFIWKSKVGGGSDNKYVVPEHEYILCYAKDFKLIDYLTAPINEEYKKVFRFKDEYYLERGPFYIDNLHKTGLDTDRPNLIYPIECPDGSKIMPPTIWRLSKEEFQRRKNDGRIYFKKNREGKWQVYSKTYLYDGGQEKRVRPRSVLTNVGTTREGNEELATIFDKDRIFPYPKPHRFNIYCYF